MVVMTGSAAGDIRRERFLLSGREDRVDLLRDIGLRRAVLLCRLKDRPKLRALGFGEIEIRKRLQRWLALRADRRVRL